MISCIKCKNTFFLIYISARADSVLFLLDHAMSQNLPSICSVPRTQLRIHKVVTPSFQPLEQNLNSLTIAIPMHIIVLMY